ncbi:hypothetical protein PtA15_10A129 [Puccinia triticina]|uniref:HMG box domain-containing protein n=1 Tax=Puccinia triticina TaxID=208348 RepID=A0ABY7CVM8_9BASI|nr:uncharacterized protein PtA15_10A129 [Puccinia triticina]WAQ88710.1 hypothetical protein PtA15_10A129 [Puccinia triticina]
MYELIIYPSLILVSARKGVKNKNSMNDASLLWNKLTPEAQAAYQNGVPDDDYKTDDDETPVDNGTRKSMSFKRASEQVQSFLDDWFCKASGFLIAY